LGTGLPAGSPAAGSPSTSAASKPILLEQNDEWAGQCRHMSLETMAQLSDDPSVSLPNLAA